MWKILIFTLFLLQLNSVHAELCNPKKSVKVLPQNDPLDNDNHVPLSNSYELYKKSGDKFKDLISTSGEKLASYNLIKFDAKACLSVFEFSDHWEGGGIQIYDHLTGKVIKYEHGGGYSIASNGKIFSVWDCYVATVQTDYGICTNKAYISIYNLNANKKRVRVGKYEILKLLSSAKLHAKEKYLLFENLKGIKRIHLMNLKSPLEFSVVVKTNELTDDSCPEADACKAEVFELGKVKFKIIKNKLKIDTFK